MPESDVKNNILESLANIENDINYINKIVQDLQDFTRNIKFVAKVIDLQTVCEEVLLKIDIPNNVEATCKIERQLGW
jgi:nitrogen fixation/metabolism regulation signal transduction histidine kinase